MLVPLWAALQVSVVVPTGTPEPARAALVDTCTGALGEGQCGVGGAGQRDWVAQVEETAAGAHVDLRNADGTLVGQRELRFAPGTGLRERWASIGIVVAALVARQKTPHARDDQGVRRPLPPPADPAPQPPPAPLPRAGLRFPHLLAAGVRAGPGLQPGPPRVGAYLSAHLVLAQGWPRLVVGTSYSRAGTHPELHWTTGVLGLGFPIGIDHRSVAVAPRFGAITERASARARAAERVDAESLRRWGAFVGVDAWWRFGTALSLTMGAQVDALAPDVRVRTEGSDVGRQSIVGWSVLAGTAWSP